MQKFKIKSLLGDIDNLSFEEVLECIKEKAQQKEKKTFVATINTEILMLARSDPQYEKVIRSADLALAESVGVMWGGQVFGKPYKERVPGADLVQELSKRLAKEPITVAFLGGKQNVAEQTANCLREKYPGLKVAFAIEEADGLQTTDYGRTAVDGSQKAVSLKCDILFVAFGSPKQEKWIYDNLDRIDVQVAIGVGGAFDFISGKVPRAPVWIRKLGLEWLFRLIIQPWRWRRQLALIRYVISVMKERLGF